MKIFRKFFPIILCMALASFVNAQTTLSAPDPPLVGTNASLKLSYARQIRDFQNDETERVLSQRMALREQALQRDLKESEEKEAAAHEQQQEQELQQRKQELVDEEVRRELKEQFLIKYVKKLQQRAAANSPAVQSAEAPDEASRKVPSESAPTPIPMAQSNAEQEALKPEPPK